MTRFLFWNYRYGAPDKEEILARVVLAEGADLLILAETNLLDETTLLHALGGGGRAYVAAWPQHNWIRVYSAYPSTAFSDWKRDQGRLLFRKLHLPGKVEILLGAVHLPSGLNLDRGERAEAILPVARTIREAQNDPQIRHSRTVVVGDFNLNPFDEGMIFPEKFGSMMTRDSVRRISGTSGGSLSRFYNPMWSLMGREYPEDAPGTYYWSAPRDYNTYWNYLDQVLIGPDLMDSFVAGSLRILTSISDGSGGQRPLLRPTRSDGSGSHWKIEISDHLPIVFDLELPGEVQAHA